MNGGATVIRVMSPTVEGFLSRHDIHESEGEDAASVMTFTTVLVALTTAVAQCDDPELIWTLLPAVKYCSSQAHAVAAWTQEEAWELLLAMVTSTPSHHRGAGGSALDALSWAVANTDRDFESLPTVVRCISALVLLSPSSLSVSHWEHLLNVVKTQLETLVGGDIMNAYCSLGVILVTGIPHHAAPALFPVATRLLLTMEDSDERDPDVAFLIGAILAQRGFPLQQLIPTSHDLPGEFVEKLVLAMDMMPHRFQAKMVIAGLGALEQAAIATSAGDRAMIHEALRSQDDLTKVASGDDSSSTEARDPLELICEAFGFSRVNPTSPHAQRLQQCFSFLSP
jgi:hypothetical protein